MTRIIRILALSALFTGAMAFAQSTLPSNIYAVGASYNNAASPSIAGTALYAKLASADSGTYAFTVVDILPTSVKPFTVSTNIGVGVAQKAFNIGPVNVFIPTSAGVSITGTNTGWSWSGGALFDYNIKKDGKATAYHLMPNVRFLKSSVSNGSDYQLIGGLLFGWGQ